jgi:hypothetical protein
MVGSLEPIIVHHSASCAMSADPKPGQFGLRAWGRFRRPIRNKTAFYTVAKTGFSGDLAWIASFAGRKP